MVYLKIAQWQGIAVYIPWDIVEYASECVFVPSGVRSINKLRFPCVQLGRHEEPLTIVDRKGRIILWYLPELLSRLQQVRGSILPH